jgi:signal transduction histidine kinase
MRMSSESKAPFIPERPPAQGWRERSWRLQERFYLWLVSFGREPKPRRPSWQYVTVLAAIIGFIGWIDYLLGVRISLALFYSLPIMLAVAWFGWWPGVLCSVGCVVIRVVGDAAAGGHHLHPATLFWNRTVNLSMYVLLVTVVHALILSQRTLEKRVRQRTADLERAIEDRNELQKQLFEISRRERSAIGHDLHDGLGQHLTATSLAADVIARELMRGGNPHSEKARQLVRMLQDGISKTRQIARGLLLAEIEPDTLVSELEELASAVSADKAVRCVLECRQAPQGLDVTKASHLFYIAQEAVSNALRHAQPSQIVIRFGREDACLRLDISDDGQGIPENASGRGGMGLRIMAHRAELIGGRLEISQGNPRGTVVDCRVPLGLSADKS